MKVCQNIAALTTQLSWTGLKKKFLFLFSAAIFENGLQLGLSLMSSKIGLVGTKRAPGGDEIEKEDSSEKSV